MRTRQIAIGCSLAAGALMAATSIAGVYSDATYARESASWAAQGVGQDVVNLFFVFPILVVSALVAWRRPGSATRVWLGALLYMIYSFALYAFFVHFGPWFLAYVAAFGLSTYAFIGGTISELARSPVAIVSAGLRKTTGVFLICVAGLFTLLWLADIVPATLTGTAPTGVIESGFPVNPIHVLDLALFLPATVLIGVELLRWRPLGFLFAAPILTFLALMGGAIVAMAFVMRARGFDVGWLMIDIPATIAAAAAMLAFLILRESRHLALVSRGPDIYPSGDASPPAARIAGTGHGRRA